MDQLEMFATTSATTSSTSIAGLTVRLDRPADPGHRRCGPFVIIGSSRGPHAAAMTCRSCGKFRGWLGGQELDFINQTRARFGTPEIIILRNPSHAAGAGGKADIT